MRFPVFQAVLLVGLASGCAHHHTAATPAPAQSPQYKALYSKPLTSLGAKYAQLTPAAQATVLAQVGSAQIYDVNRERRGDRTYYIVSFRDATVYPPLYVAPDGSVLNPDLSVLVPAPKEVAAGSAGPVSLNDLPPEVTKTLEQQAPGAEVESVYREIWGDHAIYTVSFKDEAHHPTLRITAEGTPLRLVTPKTP